MSECLPLPALPQRPRHGHKGSFGTVLVVAGSGSYPGAAALAALGAGRMGAGLVRLALPEAIAREVLPAVPFAVLVRAPGDERGHFAQTAVAPVLAAAQDAQAVVLGPGLGQGAGAAALLAALIASVNAPLLLDADALNLLACLGPGALAARVGPTVLTPHPGEFVRLAQACAQIGPGAEAPAPMPAPTTDTERELAATALARAFNAVVVLKGAGTVTSDGRRLRVESAGNPGMGRGGMGDVLAGAAGALLARLPGDAAAAAALAVHLHAVAGDLAAAELGQESLLPEDVARLLGRAAERHQAAH